MLIMSNFFVLAEQEALRNLYRTNNKVLGSILFTVDESLLPHFKKSLKQIYTDKFWNYNSKGKSTEFLFKKYCNEGDKDVWEAVLVAISNGYARQLFCNQSTTEFEDDDYEFNTIADMPDMTFHTIATAIAATLTDFLADRLKTA